jgi:hypothetical protein
MSVVNYQVIVSHSPFSQNLSDSTLYLEGSASAKVTVCMGDLKVFFLCQTCHVLAKVAFATFAAKWR